MTQQIFESPDGGKTIYKRESLSSKKELVKADTKVEINTPISLGELVDKITILQIKTLEIKDESKLKNIKHELSLLSYILDKTQLKPSIAKEMNELYAINYKLWSLEDTIRECERVGTFEEIFINTARLIYKTNDERSRVKKQINVKFNSDVVEEKSYKEWS